MKKVVDEISEGFPTEKRALVYATRAWVHFDEGLGINAMPLVFREDFGMSGLWYFFPDVGVGGGGALV